MKDETVLTLEIDHITIRNLVKNYVFEVLKHKTNDKCRSISFEGEKSGIKAIVDVENPLHPAKKKIEIKLKEAIDIIAKTKNISLNDCVIEIDRY